MNGFWYRFFSKIKELGKNRVLVIFAVFVALFFALTARVFKLQIIEGEEYQQELKTSIVRTLSIPAARGGIYDSSGRPLAVNSAAFSVQIDDSVSISYGNREVVVRSLYENLMETGETVLDTLPITNTAPYEFTISPADAEDWKSGCGVNTMAAAEEALSALEKKYGVQDMPREESRRIISLGEDLGDKNLMLLSLMTLLDTHGEKVVDDLPISDTAPYEFLHDSEEKEISWKKSVGMTKEKLSYSADDTMVYLENLFGVPECISQNLRRRLVSIRYLLYLQRYKKYQPLTVASEISDRTVAAIEENNALYPGVSIDTTSLRLYTQGKYFSHILGYIRRISDTELSELSAYGYAATDIVGKTGIEKAYELTLRGRDGERIVEVDSVGRQISSVETKEPLPGGNVYLTIDTELQKIAYDRLEEVLADVLIGKLTAAAAADDPISLAKFFVSMTESNNIDIKGLLAAETGERYNIRETLLSADPGILSDGEEGAVRARELLAQAIERGAVSPKQMVLLLWEEGRITGGEDYLGKIKAGAVTPLSVIIKCLRDGDITPGETNLDPCSGSVVVSDVNTGAVLAIVSYPSYDNNELVNSFNNEYYAKLLNNPATPLVNRPLSQKKAPGSTLKMATAVAALESGAITTKTTVKDEGTFTKAGIPYAKCWVSSSGGTHGIVDVRTALEVSCNYFFYEVAYSMGNAKEGTTLESINRLNEYMAAFGLNDYTGIEIGESKPGMASPEYKKELMLAQNPDAPASQTKWSDGDTIRTAIGQSVNNFAPAQLNKYIATLASGGIRYRMHMVDRTESSGLSEKTEVKVENILKISEENLDAVFDGMVAVGKGERGTLRGIFSDFPIDVALKSGTAQENLARVSHSWVVGFAPAEDPRIAITVMIPYGEAKGSPAAVVTRDVISEYFGLNYKPTNSNMENTLAE